jgi:hypothetical protein
VIAILRELNEEHLGVNNMRKSKYGDWVWWCSSVILATWEANIIRIVVGG